MFHICTYTQHISKRLPHCIKAVETASVVIKATKEVEMLEQHQKIPENNLLDKDKCSFSDSFYLINPMHETRLRDEEKKTGSPLGS